MPSESEISSFEPQLFSLKFYDSETRRHLVKILPLLNHEDVEHILNGLKNLAISRHAVFPDTFQLKSGKFVRISATIKDFKIQLQISELR